MKTGVIVLSLVLPATFAGYSLRQPAGPQPAIGYISSQRIMASTTEGRAALARLQAAQRDKATDIRTKQQTLEATRQQIARTADAAKKAELQRQEQQQRSELERAAASLQSDLQASQREVQADMKTVLDPILADIVKGRNLQLVLNGDLSVVWAAPSLDLTGEVIQRLNAKPPAPQAKP
jgi:Skp family chaperone for outer membrane proteins